MQVDLNLSLSQMLTCWAIEDSENLGLVATVKTKTTTTTTSATRTTTKVGFSYPKHSWMSSHLTSCNQDYNNIHYNNDDDEEQDKLQKRERPIDRLAHEI